MENPAAGSSAAARLSGPIWPKKPDVGSTAGYQGWALLDSSILEEDRAAATGLAVGTASDGRAVRVSLRLAEPPASSYVQLHTDADVHVEPTLLAADGDLLLIYMVVAVVRDPPFISFEPNFFVYKANPDPEMGWLRLIPQFADRVSSVRHTGIACRDKDYVVAGFLNVVARQEDPVSKDGEDQFKEVGTISRFSSSTDQWDILEVPIPYDPENGLYKYVWESDDLFTHDGFMFWVDYHRGMLYCDVFAESPLLKFIKLPGIQIWGQDHDYSRGRQLPRAYRSVGVSRGQVTFVDIDDGLFGTRKTSGFSITTWSLNMADLRWAKVSVIQVDKLWSQPEFDDSPLPGWVPEYPVVSKQDGGILHCIFRGPDSSAKAWVVTLDMEKKALKSYRPFINERKLASEEYDPDTRNIFCDTPFICCDFDWLNKTTGCPRDPVEMKWGTTLTSVSETKKRKSPSSNLDFLELYDTSDDDDAFSDTHDTYDSDSSLETPASRAMHSLSLSFFGALKTMTVEELTNPTRHWHCPVCRNDPGAVVWYKGLHALMDHARTEVTQRVELHGKLLTLLEYKLEPKLACQPMTKACLETREQKNLDLKVKMALDLLKLPLKGHATKSVMDIMTGGTLWRKPRPSQTDFKVHPLEGF